MEMLWEGGPNCEALLRCGGRRNAVESKTSQFGPASFSFLSWNQVIRVQNTNSIC